MASWIGHRDLKPENIMLVWRQGDRDFVKVLDFGLAKVATESAALGGEGVERVITQHGAVFGTPRYMAPEQCIGEPCDGRTDLYALGIIFYEMLAGAHPFEGHGSSAMIRSHLTIPIPPLAERAPHVQVPASLEALVRRLTMKDPAQRFATATEVLTALGDICAQENILPPEPSVRMPTPTPPPTVVQPAESSSLDSMATQDLAPGDAAAAAPAPARLPEPTPESSTAGSLSAGELQQKPASTSGSAAAVTAPAAARVADPVRTVDEKPAARTRPGADRKRAFLLGLAALPLVALTLYLVLRPRPEAARVQPRPGVHGATQPRAVPGTAPAPAPAQAQAQAQALTQAQIDQELGKGLPALLALAEQYPEDARVQRGLAHAHMAQKDGLAALRCLARAIALNDDLVPTGEVAQAAVLAASNPKSLEAAATLLETELGTSGVDVLYALATRPTPSRAKVRFSQSLSKPEVLAHASPAALIALELRAATRCEAKRALLGRASRDGDERALPYLRPLLQSRGCGTLKLGDCWPCLRHDPALQGAITAITSRVNLLH